jgi:hypothetical protein
MGAAFVSWGGGGLSRGVLYAFSAPPLLETRTIEALDLPRGL